MTPEIDYNEFPAGFAHCFNEQCRRGETCLRRQLALRIPKERGCVCVVNPAHLESATGESCSFFLLDQPQRYARGISHLFDDVPLRKAQVIKSQILAYLGRTNYYRCKRGERLVKPDEQAYILKLFRAQAVDGEPKYDEYQDYYKLR